MDGEILNFAKVWLSVFISLSYCYAIGKITQEGATRVFCVLPIICLFLFLPLNLSSVHLGGLTSFFISWLANFKLLLFAFGKGPLSLDPSIPLTRFIIIACLPIKIQHAKGYPHKGSGQDEQNPLPKNVHKSILNYAIKSVLLAMLLHVYDYSDYIHPKILLLLYCFHIYFLLEIILAAVATTARRLLGFELEPQFNEPYLSTSLQDFWGRRWNIVVTRILRPAVYEPIISSCTPLIGRSLAPLPAVLGTFVVSALMHELIFYYLGRVMPTWEITWFFLLHGVCLTVEICLKKAVKDRWRLPRLLSNILTAGFVLVTGFWLFFPQLLRCRADVRAFEEYAAVGAFLRNVAHGFSFSG